MSVGEEKDIPCVKETAYTKFLTRKGTLHTNKQKIIQHGYGTHREESEKWG